MRPFALVRGKDSGQLLTVECQLEDGLWKCYWFDPWECHRGLFREDELTPILSSHLPGGTS